MASSRSLFAASQRQPNQSHIESRRGNGRFWSRRSMNDSSPDEAVFSFRSIFSPFLSPANMNQPNEQTKLPPQAAANHGVSRSPDDYAEKLFHKFHQHNLSDSTTGSNDSSPTTTISTVDDSSATEPSPGSSPESPPPTTFAVGMLRPRTSDDNRPFFELQKQAPPKKGRNLKNLAVNTTRHPNRAASTTSLPLPPEHNLSLSSVASPSFVKPPTPAKRKPSNLGLTLLTPAKSKAPPQEIRLAIPSTPAVARPGTLRHFQSSPSLPLYTGFGSQNAVGPPVPRVGPALDTIISPVEREAEQPVEEEEEQNFDIPLSKEEQPEAYPDGPICVYHPHIDLYLEPTADQARKYDVILNVASEVVNPFDAVTQPIAEESEIRIDGGGGIQFAPKRDRSPAQKQDRQSTLDSSPTTPKATPLNKDFPADVAVALSKDPEYIHIKWEHNSDIVPDLLRLVKLIDEKAMQGKRVLVHCQCGVSRSASLVVAYGLYKNPVLSVQEAYDAVKRKSRWIGPNMNLIMQLQEFRTSLMNGGVLAANRGLSPITPSSALSEWRGPFAMSPSDRNAPLSAGAGPVDKSQTAESLPVLSAGPSSAPSGLPWPAKDVTSGPRARAISAVKPGTAYVNPSGHIVPVVPMLNVVEPDAGQSQPKQARPAETEQSRDESDSATPTEPISSPQAEEFALTPLQPSPDFDPADSYGLMSPSSSEFPSSPFDRDALLAQLGMGPIRQQEEAPRRSTSLRSKSESQQGWDQTSALNGNRNLKLRGKISSPSIREQQRLQSLQTRIEASLPHRSPQNPVMGGIDEALQSPRATEFTQNPFALSISIPSPSSTSTSSPSSAGETPQSTDSDPRSPAQKGLSPIPRNILDVL